MPKILTYTGSLEDIDNSLTPKVPLNLAYPFESNNDVIDSNYTTIKNIKSNLLSFLHTEQGERRLDPSYGVTLRKYLFEHPNKATKEIIQKELQFQITKWIKNIIINDIEIKHENNIIYISLSFSTKTNPNEVETLSTTL